MRVSGSFLALAFLVAAASWGPARVIAHVDIPQLTESSGLAASRMYPGVFWSHNDSGGGPYLFAFDRSGKNLGRWSVVGARNYDWEDVAIGPGPVEGRAYLYIGDLGDNNYARESVTIYRVPEPAIASPGRRTQKAEAFRFEYPDRPHDAEALLVHPRTGTVYIVTKARGRETDTKVFKAAPPLLSGEVTMLRHVTDLHLPGGSLLSLLIGRITGGAISPDGKRLMLCDYGSGWETVLAPGAENFDDIWKGNWTAVDLGARDQGEAVTYGPDGRTVFATSEGALPALWEAVRDGNIRY